MISFRRMMSVNRRMMHVQCHDERVHLANVHSQRGIGCTQCRKVSSPAQNESSCPRVVSVIRRELSLYCREVLTLCGKPKAKFRVVRALRAAKLAGEVF